MNIMLNLGPLPQISHYLYEDIPKPEKKENPKSETLHVPSILDKEKLNLQFIM
jgi:hypothetical protein